MPPEQIRATLCPVYGDRLLNLLVQALQRGRAAGVRASHIARAFLWTRRGAKVRGHWKIEDVYLDGTVSQLAVRRSEFTAILRAEGPDGLLSKLKNQSDGLLKGS